MPFNIGVNVVEVDGSAAPTIVAAPISVAGFLARTQRGIPNLAVPISGFSDFVNNFGSYTADSQGNLAYTAFAVRGFFDNGGTQAYVARVVNTVNSSNPASAARVMLVDRATASNNTLGVSAGIRGSVDPGSWGNALAVTIADHPRGSSFIPAQIFGTVAEPFVLPFALNTHNQLQATLPVTANGTAVTITFNATSFANSNAATAAEVATVINRQTTAFQAAVTPDRRLVLASTVSGTANPRLVVPAGSTATALGFVGTPTSSDAGLSAGSTQMIVQSTGGLLPGSAVRLEAHGYIIGASPLASAITSNSSIKVSADGGNQVTITFTSTHPKDVVTTINSQAQGFTANLTVDNHLVLYSNTYGPNSKIAVQPGTTDASAALGLTTGSTEAAGFSEYHVLTAVSEQYKLVTLGDATSDALPPNFARLQSVEFDLVVNRVDVTGKSTEIERFESLSMQDSLDYYAPTVVNNQASGSRYITVTDQESPAHPGQNVPAANSYQLGQTSATAGSDGDLPADTDYIGDPALRTGLYAFDPVSIQLLTCAETTSTAVVQASMGYCENRGDAMFVGTVPGNLPDIASIKTYASALKARKVYGALYAPWIQVVNPLDTTGKNPAVWIPPVGHVLGTYARIGDARGVWKAPAGDEALLINALGVQFNMTDVDHTDLVKNGSVNGIRAIPGSGIIVDASRTLSTDTRWLFVNVRRLFNFVKSSLRDGLRFVAQEPNTADLQRAINFNVIRPFLLDLWQRGAFGSDPPEQVFTIICDATNNPPSQVNLGNLTVEVYFYPVKPAETIIIIVGQQESGPQSSES